MVHGRNGTSGSFADGHVSPARYCGLQTLGSKAPGKTADWCCWTRIRYLTSPTFDAFARSSFGADSWTIRTKLARGEPICGLYERHRA